MGMGNEMGMGDEMGNAKERKDGKEGGDSAEDVCGPHILVYRVGVSRVTFTTHHTHTRTHTHTHTLQDRRVASLPSTSLSSPASIARVDELGPELLENRPVLHRRLQGGTGGRMGGRGGEEGRRRERTKDPLVCHNFHHQRLQTTRYTTRFISPPPSPSFTISPLSSHLVRLVI
jgi:hypothetical protein